jgi:ketosteroid isomerase-like protein
VQRVGLIGSLFLFSVVTYSQTDVQPLLDSEQSFDQIAASNGIKSAFLQFLADDAIIFRPGPTNGREFWQRSDEPPNKLLSRNVTYADISANGLLGYTTGNWRLYEKGKSESFAKFGQYVTIWEKKPNGQFLATIDISIDHDKLPFSETDRTPHGKQTRDINQRGWSPANASMSFTRLSMAPGALGGAYLQFAGKDMRFLRDGAPPIIGKKNVVEATRHYLSIRFPENIILYQAADMAYTWNPCEFADSNEGMEKGNCLHIWKLRNKKWWIVLGVFARIPNETPPVLKPRLSNTAIQ